MRGSISTLNVDLALLQQNARVAFFIKRNGRIASSNADLNQDRVSDFKRKLVKLCVSKLTQVCELRVQTPLRGPHPKVRTVFLLKQTASNWVNHVGPKAHHSSFDDD